MSKTFRLFNLIHGSIAVLGERLVYVLLKDLFEVGNVYGTFDEFHLKLKEDGRPDSKLKVVGGSTTRAVVDSLVTAKIVKYPMVIVCLLRILQRKGADVHEALKAGLGELKLGHFPAVRVYDAQKHEGLYWNWSFGLWVILDVENCPCEADRMTRFLTPFVANNLESLQLCHASAFNNRKLPWLILCIEELMDLKLSNEDLVIMLTFITCIARLTE